MNIGVVTHSEHHRNNDDRETGFGAEEKLQLRRGIFTIAKDQQRFFFSVNGKMSHTRPKKGEKNLEWPTLMGGKGT